MKGYYVEDGNQLFSITLEEWTGNVHKWTCATHRFFFCIFHASQANVSIILLPYLSCPKSCCCRDPPKSLGRIFFSLPSHISHSPSKSNLKVSISIKSWLRWNCCQFTSSYNWRASSFCVLSFILHDIAHLCTRSCARFWGGIRKMSKRPLLLRIFQSDTENKLMVTRWEEEWGGEKD